MAMAVLLGWRWQQQWQQCSWQQHSLRGKSAIDNDHGDQGGGDGEHGVV